jgi:hypothetical protein
MFCRILHLQLWFLLVLTYEMSHSDVDSFALIINVLNDNWVPMHVIVRLFELNETIG